MLSSIFITLFIVGFILFVLAAEKWDEDGSLAYIGMSFIIFMVLMAQSIFIEVPFIAASSSTADSQQYLDLATGAVCLGFVILDIIMFLLRIISWKDKRNSIAMP